MTLLLTTIAIASILAVQPGGTGTEPGRPEPAARFEPFPGVVVDRGLQQIELAGFVPIDAQQAETPEVWIEIIAESGGVRDHEALVSVDADAQQIHAALLLLGLEPGSPGVIRQDGERTEPAGPEVAVLVRYERDGETVTEDPTEWIQTEETGEVLSEREPSFVFGGSSERTFGEQTVYMARAEGVVVGLSTFGTGSEDTGDIGVETIGMIPVLSPDTGSGDPLWLARPDRVPAYETPVTLIIRRLGS